MGQSAKPVTIAQDTPHRGLSIRWAGPIQKTIGEACQIEAWLAR
ncbi:hypothetical protein Gotur_024000 [Gossypium turneri]